MYDDLALQFKAALDTIPQMKTEYPEIEIRLGKFHDNRTFVSSLPKHVFDHLLLMFRSCKKWNRVCEIQSVDYFQKNIRLSKTKDNVEYIQKIKFGASDMKNEKDKIDIRLSISTENPMEIPKEIDINNIDESLFDTIRHKLRYSFYYKNIWKYDFTIVNCSTYEIEIELLNPKNTLQVYNANYLVESLIMKIKDIDDEINKHNLLCK